MARLTPDEYLSFIESESARFRAALTECDPATRVPACPAWDAADLLWHLTGVQAFWAHVINTRPEPPRDYHETPRPSSYDEMLQTFDDASLRMQGALAAADPGDAAWSWSPEQTVGFTYRRQAHEALIHRLDAEQTAGCVTDLDARLSADGVDETLDVMFSNVPEWGTFTPLSRYVRVDLTDTDDCVWVELGRFTGTDPDGISHDEDDIRVIPAPDDLEPDAIIEGPAAIVNARIWRRGDGAAIELAGDLNVVDRFRAAIHHPIN